MIGGRFSVSDLNYIQCHVKIRLTIYSNMIKLKCQFILQQNLYHMTKSIKGVIKIGNIQQDLENLLKCYIISSEVSF